MTVNCAIYLRISQDPNADGLAVSRQRESCLAIAAARGWTVVEEFADTVSASKRDVQRPEYDRMFDLFKGGKYDALVVWDLDRLTRQPRQLEDWIDLAEARALLIVTANGEADLSTDNGRMFARIKATVARGEIEAKGRRQKAKNLQNAAAGKPVPGRRRFGYEPGNITVREEEAAVVRDVFRGIIARESVRSLAATHGQRLGWVRDLIANKSYAGYVKHRGVYAEEPGAIEPLVTLADWEAANLILGDPTRKTTPGQAPKHLMSGLARCGVCGATMYYMRAYMCSKATDHVNIQKALVDEQISDAIFVWAMGDAGVEPTDSARLTDLLAALAAVEEQREAAQELYLLPGANRATVQKTLARLGSEAARLTREVDEERAGYALSGVLSAVRGQWWDRRDVPEWTEHEQAAVDAWPDYWAGLGIDKQREIVRALLAVTVDKGRGPGRVRIEYV